MTPQPRPSAEPAQFTRPAQITRLSRLVHGTDPDGLRHRLTAALSAGEHAETGDADHGRRTHLQLRRIAHILPPARELLRDPHRLAVLGECTGIADPPLYMATLSHYLLCLGSIVTLSDDPGRLGRRWAALETAHAKGVFLVTEIGDGSSHLGIRTTAEFDPGTGEFTLHTPDAGAAKFSGVGSPGLPQTAVVCARLLVGGVDRGVFSFVVDLEDERGPAPGVEISGRVGLPELPLDYALVRFRGARLRPEQWLRDGARIDASGAFHDPLGTHDARLARTLCVGQGLWATLPSAMAAMARQCAARALRHCAHRRAHGRLAPGEPVLAYRPQQHALFGCLAESLALTFAGSTAQTIWGRALAAGGGAGRGGPDTADRDTGGGADRGEEMTFSPWTAVDRPLAAWKAHTVDAAARVAAECQHRSGLPGYLAVNRLAGYHGFAHAFDSAGGDSRLIMLDTGRALAEEAGDALTAAPPPPGMPVDHPDWWPAVVRALESRLTQDLRQALQDRTKAGLGGLERWNPLLGAARELGEAYASRLTARSLADAIETVDDPELQDILRPLAALYGVAEARRLSGRLLSAEVIDPATARALPVAMDELCDRLLPHLPLLTEALAAPGASPTAPLGASDYAATLTNSLDWPTERPT